MDGSGYNPLTPAPEQRSAWRFFPLGVVLCLFLVAVANGVMIYYAESTFPGEAITDEFTLANNYDRVFAAEKAEAALGWNITATLDGGVAVLRVQGRDKAPLADLVVRAIAERPMGPEHRTPMQFTQPTPGTYRADTALTEAGNWKLVVLAKGAGGTVHEVFNLLVP